MRNQRQKNPFQSNQKIFSNNLITPLNKRQIIQSRVSSQQGFYQTQQTKQFQNNQYQEKRQEEIPQNFQNLKMASWVWPQGILPYKIDKSFTSDMKALLKKAIQEFQQKTPIRFRFIEIDEDSDTEYVLYTKSEENYSYTKQAGRVPDVQCYYVYILQNAEYGDYLHETMHILGFYHEQQRVDRDTYVKLNENIDNPSQYEQRGYNIGKYDLDSIMHYYCDKNMQMKPQYNQYSPGRKEQLSDGDIKALNLIYGDKKCSYDVYHEEMIPQEYFICQTCCVDNICIPCCTICHKGHQVKSINVPKKFYCSCGKNKHDIERAAQDIYSHCSLQTCKIQSCLAK